MSPTTITFPPSSKNEIICSTLIWLLDSTNILKITFGRKTHDDDMLVVETVVFFKLDFFTSEAVGDVHFVGFFQHGEELAMSGGHIRVVRDDKDLVAT